jgi:lysophospholipase L1-like esterase
LVSSYTKKHSYLTFIDTYDIVLGADGKPREELFVPDKLHFNDAGYRLLAEKVRPQVN